MVASLALVEVLTNAVDRGQTVSVSLSHLLVQSLRGLTVVLAALRVTQNYVLATQRCDHLSRNLTGVSTLSLGSAVLSTNSDTRATNYLQNLAQVSERGAYDEVHAVANLALASNNILCQLNAFNRSGVHLPVTSYNLLSHNVKVCLSVNI